MVDHICFPSVILRIFNARKKIVAFYVHALILGFSLIVLGGCQSQPSSSAAKSMVKEQPLQLIQQADGLQNVHWKLLEIQGKKAQFFYQMPFIRLMAQGQYVQGSTGCNSLSGKYFLEYKKQKLTFEAKAGHQSCDGALAQEAQLMDALMDARRFQLVGNRLHVFDQTGKVLFIAQK